MRNIVISDEMPLIFEWYLHKKYIIEKITVCLYGPQCEYTCVMEKIVLKLLQLSLCQATIEIFVVQHKVARRFWISHFKKRCRSIFKAFPISPIHRYRGFREPPDSPRKYEYTRTFWHVFTARFVFIVIFEVSFLVRCTSEFRCTVGQCLMQVLRFTENDPE